MEIQPAAGTVRLKDPDMSLDLGAVAKGYAAGKVARELGEENLLIDAGGNIVALGRPGDGRAAWDIGVSNPEGGTLCVVPISNGCAVTSGGSLRYFTVDGVSYHHIIDPDTLYPADLYQQVTVFCTDSALADWLSTSAFLLEYESSRALVESVGAQGIWILPDGGNPREQRHFPRRMKYTRGGSICITMNARPGAGGAAPRPRARTAGSGKACGKTAARPAGPKKRHGCLFHLVSLGFKLLFVLALAVALLYGYPVGLLRNGSSVSASRNLPGGYTNILLLGVDVDANHTQRSDSIIIASFGGGKVKLTSLLRDTRVNIPGHGEGKLNAAYAYGGPELLMRTINEAYDMNITQYAAVDYFSFPPIIDAVGGIDIPVTEEELGEVNRNITQCWEGFQARGYTITPLATYGDSVHLDGVQALAYARIRKIGYDYARTSRQRTVLNAFLQKAKSQLWNPVRLLHLAQTALDSLDTNLHSAELLSLGLKALFSDGMEQFRLPADGAFTEDGSYLVPDWEENRNLLKEFIYG